MKFEIHHCGMCPMLGTNYFEEHGPRQYLCQHPGDYCGARPISLEAIPPETCPLLTGPTSYSLAPKTLAKMKERKAKMFNTFDLDETNGEKDC